MKILVILISAGALVFSSCATSQKGAGRSSAAGPAAAAAASIASAQEVVGTKEKVLFADGTLDEYVAMEYDPSFTNMVNQSRHSASGALLETVEFAYQDESGWLTTKLTRDMEDRLRARVVYQYNSQGWLWRETLTNNAGKAVSSYEYGYDARGNRISRIVNNGAGVKLAETRYTFNDGGLITASETSDGAGRKINSTENEYDSRGNLTSQKIYNANGELTTVISAVWTEGREVRNEQQGADGTVQIRVTNEYGPNGILTRKTVENLQGESTQIFEYEYTPKPGR
jgi:YD repeat-containing protein